MKIPFSAVRFIGNEKFCTAEEAVACAHQIGSSEAWLSAMKREDVRKYFQGKDLSEILYLEKRYKNEFFAAFVVMYPDLPITKAIKIAEKYDLPSVWIGLFLRNDFTAAMIIEMGITAELYRVTKIWDEVMAKKNLTLKEAKEIAERYSCHDSLMKKDIPLNEAIKIAKNQDDFLVWEDLFKRKDMSFVQKMYLQKRANHYMLSKVFESDLALEDMKKMKPEDLVDLAWKMKDHQFWCFILANFATSRHLVINDFGSLGLCDLWSALYGEKHVSIVNARNASRKIKMKIMKLVLTGRKLDSSPILSIAKKFASNEYLKYVLNRKDILPSILVKLSKDIGDIAFMSDVLKKENVQTYLKK